MFSLPSNKPPLRGRGKPSELKTERVFFYLSKMRHLPEQLSAYTPILGTAKERNITTFQQIYGPVLTADPENLNGDYMAEPRNLDPSVPARFKTRRILEGYQVPEGEKKVALGADVVFVNGQRHLKPEGKEGELLELEMAEAVRWYCSDAFVVHWLISFAVESEDGLRKIAVLDLEGQYKEPLSVAEVKESYSAKINARIPLVEKGEGRADFYLSNSYQEERVAISHELAEMLVVDRVLPMALFESLLQDEGELVEAWELVYLDFISLIQEENEPDQPLTKDGLGRVVDQLKNIFSHFKNQVKTGTKKWWQKILDLPKSGWRL